MAKELKDATVRRTIRTIGSAALVGAAALALAAPGAQAKIIENTPYTIAPNFSDPEDGNHGTGTCDMGTEDTSDDFELTWFNTGVGRFTANERSKGFVFGTDRQRYTQTVSGLGVVYTADIRDQIKDQKLLSVDGDIETWKLGIVDNVTVFDPAGRKDYSFAHRVEVLLTLNTVSGDEDFSLIKDAGQAGGNACDDALRFSNG